MSNLLPLQLQTQLALLNGSVELQSCLPLPGALLIDWSWCLINLVDCEGLSVGG